MTNVDDGDVTGKVTNVTFQVTTFAVDVTSVDDGDVTGKVTSVTLFKFGKSAILEQNDRTWQHPHGRSHQEIKPHG